MEKNIKEKKISWKNWLIKKLLSSESTREEILSFIAKNNHNVENDLEEFEDNNEKNLIKNVFNLNLKNVEDIMVPRAEIISIEKNQSIQEVLLIIKNESHSRMPVYEKNIDNTLGFFHIKDLIHNIHNQNFQMNNILRDILYVAPKSPILDLLKRMRSSRIHMGLIVDEFGGVDGLITIEDLVEEIIGEIEDEHDAEDNHSLVSKINKTTIIAQASLEVTELEKIFQTKIQFNSDQEIDTVGGLVFYLANKVPQNNQVLKYKNQFKFKVLKATARRIVSLEITKIT